MCVVHLHSGIVYRKLCTAKLLSLFKLGFNHVNIAGEIINASDLGLNRLFYFVGNEGMSAYACADMPHTYIGLLFCYVICIMVDHHLLNVIITMTA